MKTSEEEEERQGGPKVWDCGSPLYDAYELVSVANIIDRHTMALPSPFGFATSTSEFEKDCKKTANIVIHKRRHREKAKGVKSRLSTIFTRIRNLITIKRL
ncbi:hypothetical protein Sango_1199900 [Sesamum angolense]|uniref:Uncharacterized protein n=1 Tax=Sesamum angolense TaxID=2727404 RepID=A0AAE2BX35_9LAMI|nr:hypothetical protein Sango_1199900 [Sesamum angolense]